MTTKCFFTVATGTRYLHFAYTLARSYRLHNDVAAIPFYIISDEDFRLPPDLRWVQKRLIAKYQMGTGVAYKLNFDEIAPATKSIFIDADSIVYSNIAHLFNIPNNGLQVLGLKETTGNWAGLELPKVLQEFGIPYLIRYCGAFYYLVKSDMATKICHTARQLAESDYAFQQHNKSINDEPVFSVSMAKAGIEPYPDTGNIWTDTVQLKNHLDLNTLYGKALFNNNKNFKYKYWLPEGNYSPLIVHFGSSIYNKSPWIFDALRLSFYFKYQIPRGISNAIVNLLVKPGYFLAKAIKNITILSPSSK